MNDHLQWVPIARLTSLADAGYFEATLAESGIDARVEQRDEFDAVAGHWVPVFVLQVPRSDMQHAAEVLEKQLQASSDDTSHATTDDDRYAIELRPTWTAESADENDVWTPWRPFLLVLVAAGLVYLATCVGGPPAGPQRAADAAALWNMLTESREPLRSRHRELRYDSRRRRLMVIDDIDGDGSPDVLREFENGRLVREVDIEPQPRP